jgi:hypothetical protein
MFLLQRCVLCGDLADETNDDGEFLCPKHIGTNEIGEK